MMFFLILIPFSCEQDSVNLDDVLLVENDAESFLKKKTKHYKDKYNDEIPKEYKKVLGEQFGISKKDALYDIESGEILAGDIIIHENNLVPWLLDDKLFDDEEKGYTLIPNHLSDPDVYSIIRCNFGQNPSDFENYQITTTYYFDSEIPETYKENIRAAFDEWESASNNKFTFYEVSQNGHIFIEWRILNPTWSAAAAFPHFEAFGYHVGNHISFNPIWWDLNDGTYVINHGLVGSKLRMKNDAMHEIGHTLGLAHFESQNFHVPGTQTDQNQFNVSIMATGCCSRDRTLQYLFPDDINTIQTLYPYSGSGSLECQSTNDPPDLLNDMFFTYLMLGDVNFDGRASALDIILIQREILGLSNSLTDYAIQKASAMAGTSTSLSVSDLIKLQRCILGLDSFADLMSQNQWLALADYNLDGQLIVSQDAPLSDLPSGPGVYELDYNNSSNFVSDLQKTCALMDGMGSTYILDEYDVWIGNF